jgi:hypothetical protein
MLSIGAWTKIVVGGLVAPSAEAVTCTTPIPAGEQTLNSAFQLPAHAIPVGEISRIPGGLVGVRENVNVGEIFAFVPFCATAVNASVLPTCIEALTLGVSVIFAGNGDVPGGLCPPQEGSNSDMKTRTAIAIEFRGK